MTGASYRKDALTSPATSRPIAPAGKGAAMSANSPSAQPLRSPSRKGRESRRFFDAIAGAVSEIWTRQDLEPQEFQLFPRRQCRELEVRGKLRSVNGRVTTPPPVQGPYHPISYLTGSGDCGIFLVRNFASGTRTHACTCAARTDEDCHV